MYNKCVGIGEERFGWSERKMKDKMEKKMGKTTQVRRVGVYVGVSSRAAIDAGEGKDGEP